MRIAETIASRCSRLLLPASSLSLVAALAIALAGFFCHWAVNGESFGAHDLGWAISLAFVSAIAFTGSMYAAPALALLAAVSFPFQRRAALRFLLAAAASI